MIFNLCDASDCISATKSKIVSSNFNSKYCYFEIILLIFFSLYKFGADLVLEFVQS